MTVANLCLCLSLSVCVSVALPSVRLLRAQLLLFSALLAVFARGYAAEPWHEKLWWSSW